MGQSTRINSDRFYAEFERLGKESPVSRDAESAPWRVARYDDVRQVLRDDRTFSSNVTLRARDPQESPSMLFSDLHEISLVEHDPEVLSRFCEPVQLAVNIQPNA